MGILLVLLLIGSFVAMVVGLFKPSLVIRWGEKKTRPRVMMIFGGLFLLTFIIIGITNDPDDDFKAKHQATTVQVENKESNVVAEASVPKEEDIKFTEEMSKDKISDWLWEHQFPGEPKLGLNKGNTNDDLYENNGKKYYLFVLTGLPRAIDILVDPYTGELLFSDIGIKPYSLNKWYARYISEHKNDSGEEKINEKFAWVEKPNVQNGAIVGKVKNISKESCATVFVTFTAFDASHNQLSEQLAAQANNLKPGTVWSFRIPFFSPDIASYEFNEVTSYSW